MPSLKVGISVSLSVLAIAAATSLGGCASDDDSANDDDSDEAALTEGNGPTPVKNQRTGCRPGHGTSLGPFGSCKELYLGRSIDPEVRDERGRIVTPARPSEPAMWVEWNVAMPMPPIGPVTRIDITNLTTGDTKIKRPILCAPLSFYIAGDRQALGIRVVEGRNRFTYRATNDQGKTFNYTFTATFRKAN